MGQMTIFEIREAAERRLAELQPAYDEYVEIKRMLGTRPAAPSAPTASNGTGSELLAALAKLGQASVKQVHEQMVADGSSHSLVQATGALHYAYRRGYVKRASRGLYELADRNGA